MNLTALSIIIPTKDRRAVLSASLQALLGSTYTAFEIIIVNDSKTEAVELDFKSETIHVINNPNSGVASARNLGAAHAKNEILVFMDDDMLVQSDSLEKAITAFQKHPDAIYNPNWTYKPELINSIGKQQFGRYLISNGFTSLKGWRKNMSWSDSQLFDGESGSSQFLMISRTQFISIGKYNENFPFSGYEDYEFFKRVQSLKIPVFIDPSNLIYHNEFDRVEIKSWLQRKNRNGKTQRTAVALGDASSAYKAPFWKKFIYEIAYLFENPLHYILNLIPNLQLLDFIYFRLMNLLLGLNLYAGYYKRKK